MTHPIAITENCSDLCSDFGIIRVVIMPDLKTPNGADRSSRDILISIEGNVKRLLERADDHEARIRRNESDITTIQAAAAAREADGKRMLGWGMFLAAIGGGFGNLLAKALGLTR